MSTKPTCAVFAAAILAGLMAPALAQSSSGIPAVVASGVVPQLVQQGFTFTEGPVGTAEGALYFSDIRANRTYLLEAGGKISLVRENTNGGNGLALTKDRHLLTAEGDSKRISRLDPGGKVSTVTDGSEERPLLAPNDLIVDAKGGIYFTDPGPRPVVPGRVVYVYYLSPGAKEPIVIDDKIARPNGLTITADGKTLIVDDTLGTIVFAYDIRENETVANKRAFAELRDIPPGQESVADGLALDRDGRIYITTVKGIQVFDRAGQYLGTIVVPRQPANVAFAGPDKRTLYITAREGLYKLPMLAQGVERLGK